MKVVDDFGNLLLVAPPGKVISYHHTILQQGTSSGKYVCADCGLMWTRGENPGRCKLKYEFANSGFGDKDSILKSKLGFYTW